MMVAGFASLGTTAGGAAASWSRVRVPSSWTRSTRKRLAWGDLVQAMVSCPTDKATSGSGIASEAQPTRAKAIQAWRMAGGSITRSGRARRNRKHGAAVRAKLGAMPLPAVEVDPIGGVVRAVGDDPRRVEALARDLTRPAERRLAAFRLAPLDDDDPPSAHIERIRRAQELIAAGDLYQVNLARRVRFVV